MTITIKAVYENGTLKPAQPLPFQEHERVQVTVQAAVSRVRQTAGLIGWTGSQEDADFVALSPELDARHDAIRFDLHDACRLDETAKERFGSGFVEAT